MQKYIGTRDFLPKDWNIMKYIFNIWRKTSLEFGFDEYETPIISPLELFTKKSGNEIKNQLFYFKDKGNREVCLRAELTPQLARLIINNEKAIKKPIKWFSIPRIFRYEKPQKGRGREFFQFNADIIGEKSILATCEILKLSINLLKNFKLTSKDVIIKINSRKIIDELIKTFNIKKTKEFYSLLDKKSKINKNTFNISLTKIVKKSDEMIKLLNLKQKELIKELSKRKIDVKDITTIFNNVNNNFIEFDLTIVRGLEYYTGIVFECFDRNKEFRALLGGGEYNNLISDFGGTKTPAIGVGMGDMVLLKLLKSKKLIPDLNNNKIFIATLGKVYRESDKLRQKLIQKGFNVELNISEKTLGKQLKYAQSKEINTVYILGEKEIKNNIITIKNLKSGKEKKIKLNI